MSDNATNHPESQKQRWIKYGANVALSSFVVIVLAILLTWMAQRHPRRIDTTIGGAQSLRPQTLNFIKDLKQKVRIIALYPKLKSDSHEQDYYQPVADLLNDYASKGQNITVELVDPDTDKDRFKKLVEEVTNKYGGEVKAYKAILDDLPTQRDLVDKYAAAEAVKCRDLINQVQDENLQKELAAEYLTLRLISAKLSDLKDDVDSELAQQVPSYKDAVDATSSTFTFASQGLTQLLALFDQLKSDAAAPKAVHDYLPQAQARTIAANKAVTSLLDRIHHLGELKELDEFRDQLKSKSILIMTDSGYKILQFDQLWKVPESTRLGIPSSDAQGRLMFVGEQQISMSIASLTMPSKPLVVFVRPGGGPLTGTTMQGEPGPFSAVGQRLREYNFDVQEKDASGQAAMQQEETQTREPTEQEMKKAIWVVLRFPGDSQMGPSPINSMLATHLSEGGGALVMLLPNADAMTDVLAPWGISAKTDYMVVHEAVANQENRTGDPLDAALQAIPILFLLNQYGDHPLTAPLQGLDFLIQLTSPVSVTGTAGISAKPLLPIPQIPHSWATEDAETKAKMLQGQLATKVTYFAKADPDNGRLAADIDNSAAAPLYGAAAAEKANGARMVVVGSFYFATNYLIELKDSERPDVSRLPGNGEFFVDSIFWLAHMDSMLAISPHALEVARVAEMSPAKLAFWRVGILTAGLPVAVVVAGLLVYARRRD
jgi:hypothetical protein